MDLGTELVTWFVAGLGTGLGTGVDLVLSLTEDRGRSGEAEDFGGVSTGMVRMTVAMLGVGVPDESLVGSSWTWSLLACCPQCAHNLLTSLHCRHGR